MVSPANAAAANVYDEPPNATRSFDAPLLLSVIGLAGLTLGWLVAILLGHVLHVPPSRTPDGVLGQIVVMHYSKSQEIVLYLLSLFASGVSVVAVFFEWRWFTRKLAAAGASANVARWSAAATLLVPIVLALALIPGGAIFVHTLVLPAALVLTAVAQALVWFLVRRAAAGRPPAAPDGAALVVLPSARALADVPLVFHFALVALSGTLAGCYLPFVIGSPGVADAVAALWLAWPVAAMIAYVALSRTLMARRELSPGDALHAAVTPFLPLLLLLAMPLLWFSGAGRLAVLVIVVLGAGALTAAVLRTRSQRYTLPRWSVGLALALLFSGFLATSVLLQNPTGVAGAYINPFDGENFYTWMSDGTFGRVPFRDFFWPYGPLMYYVELLFVKAGRLDTYEVAYQAFLLFVAALCAIYVMTFVLRRRISLLLAVPLILSISGGFHLRVWLGCVSIVASLWGFERRSARMLVAGGIVTTLTLLYSPEIGIASFITMAACAGWYAFDPAARRWRTGDLAFYARYTGLGVAIVVVPAAIVGVAAHALVAYVVTTVQFFSVANACCGSPFPPLFAGSNLMIPSGTGLGWLLEDETFRTFYGPPLVSTIGLAYVALRAIVRRRLDRDDIVVAALTLFAIIVFRTALGRSDAGHAQFATLPVLIVGVFLAERALFTALAAAWRMRTAPRSKRMALALAQAAALAGFALLVIGPVFRADRAIRPWFVGTLTNVRLYYTIERALPTALPVREGWSPIRSVDGELFYFRRPHDVDIPPTLAFLSAHLGPTDGVCGIPFLSRYEFLVHRSSAVPLGCDTWGLGEAPAWRQRLIDEFEQSKPRYLVYNEADWPNPDAIPWLDREPDLAAYYFEHYHVVKRIGDTLIFERGAPPPPPSSLDVSTLEATPFLRTGWYYPESDGLSALRWTALHATAILQQMPGQDVFALDAQVLTPQIPGTAPQTLTVEIDGRPVLSAPLADAVQSVRSFRGRVPPVARPTLVTVTIATDRRFAAATDPRELGVPVLSFGFTHGLGQPAAHRAPAPQRTPAPQAIAPIPTSNVPPGLGRYAQELHGLFPAPAPGCCWISQRNQFTVDVPRSAKSIALTIFVPDNAYAPGVQGLTVTFHGAPAQARHGLPIGSQTLVFALPRSLRPGRAQLDVELDKTFVPAELHINGDTTRYGVVLQRVEFR